MSQRQKTIESKLQALLHQNILLKNRNNILTEENTRLLQQIQHLHGVYTTVRNNQYQSAIKQRTKICEYISGKLTSISEEFQKFQEDQKITIDFQLMRQINPSEKLFTSIALGFDMLEKLLGSYENPKIKRKSQKLQIIENKLKNRIQQRNRMRRTASTIGVHFIKDSTSIVSHLASTARLQHQDYSYLKKFYQTLIFDVVYHLTNQGKVNHRKLETYLNSFADSIDLRGEVKKYEANLSLVQREYQMCNIGECVIKQAIDSLTDANQSLQSKRDQIQRIYDQVFI